MGANFNAYVCQGTKEEIEKVWNQAVEESLYEDGHSYSGEIGMLGHGINFLDKEFETRREAEEWLAENHEKWESADAVRIKGDGDAWLVGGWCSS